MKIGIDFDEVITNTSEPLQTFFKNKTGISIPYKSITSYDLTNVWKCSKLSVQQHLLDFYDSPLFDSITPLEGSLNGIKTLSRFHSLYIVTSRHEKSKEKTYNWIERYLNGNISDLFFTGEYESSGISKADICLEKDLEILLEDTPFHSYECAKNNIPVILFDKPWNKSVSHPKISRVYTWPEALEKIGKAKNQNI
jgi:uncharacterized protein